MAAEYIDCAVNKLCASCDHQEHLRQQVINLLKHLGLFFCSLWAPSAVHLMNHAPVTQKPYSQETKITTKSTGKKLSSHCHFVRGQ